MKKQGKGKRIAAVIITLLVAAGVLFFLERLLVPKYVDDVVEGAFVAEYYKEENKDFDVIFIGDCEVYENFSPVVLWNEYGINSYIRGSAEQYIWQSYYLLEDTLRYHKPQVVVFNIQSLQFNESQSEAYNRMSIEGMRWSASKVGAIKASMTEDEHFIEYVFPLLRYHSRWNELTKADFEYMFHSKQVTHNGYFMRIDARPAEDVPPGRPLADYSFGDKAMMYLDKIRLLCEKNDIKLLLIKAPSLYPEWYEEYEMQVEDYAETYDLPYINFLEIQDQTGIDYTTDTYDGGLHMNLSGAEKLADYIGPVLLDMGVSDRRGDPELDAIWEENNADYEAEIKEQEALYGLNYTSPLN
ncbi:MAG: SGNH/GDSL hydrolase family protein [Lachnospiraceae bacterium]|nr:SGNH/GDSL hydrolase family protein [Lachnospiraceae bacterium]